MVSIRHPIKRIVFSAPASDIRCMMLVIEDIKNVINLSDIGTIDFMCGNKIEILEMELV